MNIYKILRIAILLIFITQFTQFAYASGVRVAWVENPVSDVAGYRVYYGTASRSYQIHVDAGTFTSIEIDRLSSGTTYYFAVTAYDYSGNESAYSQEIQATMPAAPAVSTVSGASSVSGSSSESGSGSLSVSSSGSGSSTNTVSSSVSGSTSGSGSVTESPTYTLSTSVVNASGTISFSQSTEPYAQGTTVSLTAAPDSGYQVMAWTGTDDDTSLNNTNTVTMNADRTVSVEFEPVSNSEEENKAGGGGGGGGCFISTPVSERPVSQGVAFLVFAGVVLMGISSFLRRDISN